MLENKIINENCIDYLEKIYKENKKEVFDHVLTDIPYDVVSRETGGIRVFDKSHADILEFDLEKFVDLLVKLTKKNILIFCASEQVSKLNELLSKTHNVYLGVWEKTNPSPVNGQHFWLSGLECCVVASKDKIDDKDLVWTSSSGRSKNHPTEKPQKMLEILVDKFTKEGDLVADPCAGSGAHLLALKNKGRKYFGIELQKSYFEFILTRGL